MGKKKKKITLFGVFEGDREELFLRHLVELYPPRACGINHQFKHSSGGSPNSILPIALKECSRDRVFAWFDEDFDPDNTLNGELRATLMKYWGVDEDVSTEFNQCPLKDLQKTFNPNNKKPNLIVSQPVCVESMVLLTLGHELPYKEYDPSKRKKQISDLKAKLGHMFGDLSEEEFYQKNVDKDLIEERRKECSELDLLISMLEARK